MKASNLFAPTLREVPAEAEVISHQLLLRAGFIRRSAAGVYTYLPLAQRVLKKISDIVREEMNRAGGQEITLPVVQPAELWQESGRWDVYGDELFRLKDRHGREFALGPTHEEIITDLVRGEVNSYKQLPILLYQIANKYRDERRPRFGLMRGREFIMKDLYSFDKDEAGLDISYKKMYDAYTNVFTRCGVQFRPVEADSGAIGGSSSHEFMVIAESGEAAIVYCDQCDYAANIEKAEVVVDKLASEQPAELKLVETPGCKSIEAVAEFLSVPANKLIKTLVYQTEKGLIIAMVRGDRELNEVKLQNTTGTVQLHMAEERDIKAVLNLATGFIGPIGLPKSQQGGDQNSPILMIIADQELEFMHNTVCGGNELDKHYVNANFKRDFSVDLIADLRSVGAGEPCPRCGGTYQEARGIEVGQVFKLGTKYSKALGANFLDEAGKSRDMVMGCYGIGVSRTMAAAVEQNYDEHGIIWSMAIAPYHAVVVPVNVKEQVQMEKATAIYEALAQKGVEAVLDDRNERPGVKFKDSELIGYPIRITIGPKTLEQGGAEVTLRRSGQTTLIPLEQVADYVHQQVNAALQS